MLAAAGGYNDMNWRSSSLVDMDVTKSGDLVSFTCDIDDVLEGHMAEVSLYFKRTGESGEVFSYSFEDDVWQLNARRSKTFALQDIELNGILDVSAPNVSGGSTSALPNTSTIYFYVDPEPQGTPSFPWYWSQEVVLGNL